MSSTLNPHISFEVAANELLSELYQLIQQLHKVDFKNQALIIECEKLATKYRQSVSQIPEAAKGVVTLFENLSTGLKQHSLLLDSKAKIAEVKLNWKNLAETYEQAIRELKKEKFAVHGQIHVKPVNYYRNLYHVSNAVIVYFLYLYVFPHNVGLGILATLSVAAVFCETYRRINPNFNKFMVDKVFGKVSRPEEQFRVNSATYYLLSLTLVMAIAPAPAFLMALLTLGISDPVANIFGKKFGRRKLYDQKSWVGSIAFFISSYLVCYYAGSTHLLTSFSSFQIELVAFVVALTGTLTELFSKKLDDNMTIIIACTLAAWPLVL